MTPAIFSRTARSIDPGNFGRLLRFHGLEAYCLQTFGSIDDGIGSFARGNPLPYNDVSKSLPYMTSTSPDLPSTISQNRFSICTRLAFVCPNHFLLIRSSIRLNAFTEYSFPGTKPKQSVSEFKHSKQYQFPDGIFSRGGDKQYK